MNRIQEILTTIALAAAVVIMLVLALLAVGAGAEWWECSSFSNKYSVAVEWNAFHGCYVPELDMYLATIEGEK